jgi:ABC-2 type transport system ATP-binding protein
LTSSRSAVTISAMPQAFLSLKALSKNFRARCAVRGVSLDVERGQIVGLLGPNGAGKSTTINMLAGFLTPSSGDVLWEGRSIFSRMREWRRTIGVVLEDLCLFEYLTLREHLLLQGRLYGLSAGETAKRTDELLDFFRLKELAEVPAREASQGSRKKLAFGLGLIHSPDVLLLDEALNGIDAVVVKDVKELLRRMSRRGAAVVFSSHVLDAAQTLIDRCVIIDDGKIAGNAPLSELTADGRSLEDVYVETVGSGRTAAGLAWLS